LDAPSSFIEARSLIEHWVSKKLSDFDAHVDWEKPSESIESPRLAFEFANTAEAFSFFLSHKEDSSITSRDWITEVSLATLTTEVAKLSLRLSIRQARNAAQPLQRAPAFLRDLVDKVGATDSRVIEQRPLLYSGDNLADFEALLFSNRRTLPILAISDDPDSAPVRVDVNRLTSLLLGIAHVAVLDPIASRTLSDRYGKERSTWRGATRCYNPGFSPDSDPFQHKLWLSQNIARADAFKANGFLNIVVNHLFAITTARFSPYPLLTPAALKRREPETPVLVLSAPVNEAQELLFTEPLESFVKDDAPKAEDISRTGISTRIEEDNLAQAVDEAVAERLRHKEAEIANLEKRLLEAQDETAQRSQEIALLLPFRLEASELRDEIALLKGENGTRLNPVVKEFWDGFSIFLGAAKNLTSLASRTEKQEFELELAAEDLQAAKQKISKLEGKLLHKERQVDSIQSSNDEERPKVALFPNSWVQLLEGVRQTFRSLLISDDVDGRLKSCPFSSSLAKEVHDLLCILEEIAQHRKQNGSLDIEGLRIRQQYFVGNNAAFSDESDTNKRTFRSELTFPHPRRESETIFAGWHGKVNQEQFRVHFEWPIPEDQEKIIIVYIGPKLTKH